MRYASSALKRCSDSLSSSAKTATVRLPSSLAARITRMAISPRLATRILRNSAIGALSPMVFGPCCAAALASCRICESFAQSAIAAIRRAGDFPDRAGGAPYPDRGGRAARGGGGLFLLFLRLGFLLLAGLLVCGPGGFAGCLLAGLLFGCLGFLLAALFRGRLFLRLLLVGLFLLAPGLLFAGFPCLRCLTRVVRLAGRFGPCLLRGVLGGLCRGLVGRGGLWRGGLVEGAGGVDEALRAVRRDAAHLCELGRVGPGECLWTGDAKSGEGPGEGGADAADICQ